jgi:hypothetical protein
MRARGGLVALFVAVASVASMTPAGAGKTDDEVPVSDAAERAQREAGLEILALIPGAYDSACLLQTEGDIATDPLLAPFADRLLAFVACPTNDDEITLHGFKFPDAASMSALYDAYTPGGLNPETPGCETDGTWGDGRGRYKCFATTTGGSAVIWTVDAQDVVFTAFSPNGDISALESWWETDAPPIDDPPEPAELVGDDEWVENSTTLRASIPKSFRKSCRVPQLAYESLGEATRNRLYLRTALFCEPGGGVDSYLALDFQTRTSAKGYVEAFEFEVDEAEPSVESESADCEASGTWSRAAGQKPAGDYVCYFTDSGGVFIIWSDRRQGIALVAGRTDGDAEKLLEFYADAAGPLPNPALSG